MVSGVDNSGLHLVPLLSVEFTARMESYVGLVVKVESVLLLLFQIPLCLCLLISKKLLNVSNLYRNRKWLLVISLLIAAFLVPPDVVNQFILATLIYLLFEFMIFIGLFFE